MFVRVEDAASTRIVHMRFARLLERNKENTTKIRIAILAACTGAFALVQVAQAGDVFGGAAVGIVIGTKSPAKAQPNNQKLKAASGTSNHKGVQITGVTGNTAANGSKKIK